MALHNLNRLTSSDSKAPAHAGCIIRSLRVVLPTAGYAKTRFSMFWRHLSLSDTPRLRLLTLGRLPLTRTRPGLTRQFRRGTLLAIFNASSFPGPLLRLFLRRPAGVACGMLPTLFPVRGFDLSTRFRIAPAPGSRRAH